MTIVAVNGGGNTPNETREGADLVVGGDGADRAGASVDKEKWIEIQGWDWEVESAAGADERYSFTFDDTSSSGPIITSIDSVTSNEPVNSTDDGLGGSSGSRFRYDTIDPSSDEPQQFTSDDGGAGAQGDWIWNVNVSTTHAGTPVAADYGRDGSIALLGTSDALAPTDFFVA
jgi:hypothetical protein